MKQLFFAIFIIMLLTVQCKQNSINDRDFEIDRFEVKMGKDAIHFHIEDLRLKKPKYENDSKEYSIWQKREKIISTYRCSSSYNSSNYTFDYIDAKIPYTKLIELGINGKCRIQFSFLDSYNKKYSPVVRKNIEILQNEIKEKLSLIDREKKRVEEKKEADKSKFKKLIKEGLSDEDIYKISSMVGMYKSVNMVQELQGGPELHEYTLVISYSENHYFLSAFGNPNVGGLFAGQIVKVNQTNGTKTLITFFNEDEKFYILEINFDGSDNYFVRYNTDESTNWQEIGMMKRE